MRYFSYTVPSAAPENVSAVALDATTVELLWEAPPLDSQNGIIRHYSIDILVRNTRETFKLQSENVTQTLIMNLHPYYEYSFQVAAITIGAGPLSMAVTATTSESGMSMKCLFCKSEL